MALMSEVKCSRCDRKYSGLKSRCPYCGARRNKHGKQAAEQNDNSTAKLLIGIVILALLIVAVVVLIISSVKSNNGTEKPSKPTQQEEQTGNSDNITNVEGNNPDAADPNANSNPVVMQPVTPEPVTPEPAKPVVTSVEITCFGYSTDDVTMSIGEEVDFDCDYTLASGEGELTEKWETDDASVIAVMQDGTVTAVGEGSATLTVTVGDKSATCLIRV